MPRKSDQSTGLSFTSPHRGEVGAQRWVRGLVPQSLLRPLTPILSPEGRGDQPAVLADSRVQQGSI
ncbi:hypothetical protein BH11PSE4_BH11PSE4_02270 [soil metagenome]